MNAPLENNGQDCYFYYNATCTKGDACFFRHEPLAKATLLECRYFQFGMCNKPNCSYRHSQAIQPMIPKKIDCFFETQPGGCQKLHCPFTHKNKENMYKKSNALNAGKQVVSSPEGSLEKSPSSENRVQPSPSFAFKSVVVDLNDGESDSEGGGSPIKKHSKPRASSNIADIAKLQELQLKQKEVLGYPFTEKERNEPASDEEIYEYHEIVEELAEPPIKDVHLNMKKRILEDNTCDLRDILRKNKQQKVSVFDRISVKGRSPVKSGSFEPTVQMNPISLSKDVYEKTERRPKTIFQRTVEGLKRDASQATDLRSRLKPKKTTSSRVSIKTRLTSPRDEKSSSHKSFSDSSDRVTMSLPQTENGYQSKKPKKENSLKSKIVSVDQKSEPQSALDEDSQIEEDLLLGDTSTLDEEELNEDDLLY